VITRRKAFGRVCAEDPGISFGSCHIPRSLQTYLASYRGSLALIPAGLDAR